VIAKGGMGIVYCALDPRARRRVALKVLRGDASAEIAARFRREAEAVARLRHRAIVAIHDVGLDGAQRYFTMDLIEGEDLEKVLTRRDRSDKELVQLLVDVADGLEHAHERGIIHRDVKPQNVLVEAATGVAKLTDFGLARDLGRSTLTEAGDLIGTPLYMSPEQLEGTAVDRRTDVYALGLILYRALAGSLPFDPRSILDLKDKVTGERPAPPSTRRPGVPAELERICLRAIERHPDDRYPTAASFASDLRAWLRGETVTVPRVSPVVRAWRGRGRFGGVVAALVLLGGIGLSAWLVYDSRRRAADAAFEAEKAAAAAVEKTNGALTRAAAATEEGKTSLARGDPFVARVRLDEAFKALEDGRAALPSVPVAARPPLEAKLAAAARAARRIRVEARLASRDARATSREAEQLAASDARAVREEASALLADDPKDTDTLVLFGRIELDANRLASACDALGRAIDLDPARLDAFYLRGEAHRRAGRAGFARMDLARALGEGAPSGAQLRTFKKEQVLAARALARLGEGDRDGADKDLDEALALAPLSADVHFALADRDRAAGNLEGALRELSTACSLAPRRGDLRRERGRLEAALDDRDRAREDLDAALQLDPEDRDATLARARLRALSLDLDGANADLALILGAEKNPRRVPNDTECAARLIAARLLRGQQNTDEALRVLEPVLAAQPRPPGSIAHLLERAEILGARGGPGDLDTAASDVRLVIAEDPSSRRAFRSAARIDLKRKDLEHARAHVEHALELEPRDGIARALRARVLRETGDARAAEELDQAARLEREDARPPELLAVGAPEDEARELVDTGRRALVAGPSSLDRAVAALRAAAFLAPELTAARTSLAEALVAKGLAIDAGRELDRALVEAPPSVEAHVLRARLILARGELDEPAIDAFGAALDMLPKDDAHALERAQIHLERGRARLRDGDARRALDDLDKACDLDPISLDAFAARQAAHEKLGDADAARADRERVQLLEGGWREPLQKMLIASLDARAKGEFEASMRLLAPAFNLVPRSERIQRGSLYYQRALLAVRNLIPGRALVDLACMIELDPTRFGDLFDEVMRLPSTIKVDSLLADAQGYLGDREPDPDFFQGFAAFVRIELSSEYREPDARAKAARVGIQALGRFLDRSPLDPAALTLRAFLAAGADLSALALRDAAAALDVSKDLGAAEYVIFRVHKKREDRERALEHLDLALKGGFYAWLLVERDIGNAADLRTKRVLDLANGRQSLDKARKIERLAPTVEGFVRNLADDGASCAAIGLKAVANQVRAEDKEALDLAANLHLSRSRFERRLGDDGAAARDVVAALEVAPGTLPALWNDLVRESIDLSKTLTTWDGRLTPSPGEQEPGPAFQRIGAELILAIAGETPRRSVEPDDKATARRPALLAARSILRAASGNGAGALADANELAKTSAAASAFLAARAEALQGHRDEALRLLAKVLGEGIAGKSFKEDPVLGRALGDDAAFRRLVD
jgi:tetratricopeptide (TPR) repeat protein